MGEERQMVVRERKTEKKEGVKKRSKGGGEERKTLTGGF